MEPTATTAHAENATQVQTLAKARKTLALSMSAAAKLQAAYIPSGNTVAQRALSKNDRRATSSLQISATSQMALQAHKPSTSGCKTA